MDGSSENCMSESICEVFEARQGDEDFCDDEIKQEEGFGRRE